MARQNLPHILNPSSFPPLNDGGPNFDWYEYGLKCLGVDHMPIDYSTWKEKACAMLIKKTAAQASLDLPNVNLLLANRLQRVIIVIDLCFCYI